METNIKLTKDQINQMVKAKEEQLKDAFTKEVKRLETELNDELSAFKKLLEDYTIPLPTESAEVKQPQLHTEKRTRIKIDEKVLTDLYNQGLSLKEIEKETGYQYVSIHSKIRAMKAAGTIQDRPKQ